jgi:hypothetical protein
MKPVDASDSSHTLEELLSQTSAESWRAIVEIGKRVLKDKYVSMGAPFTFMERLAESVKHWPPEIERLCPASWPADFRAIVEHRVRETDTYGHYLAKICGHPDLRLSDGSQAVWLERRFTGGIVELSTVKSALRLLAAAQSASSVKTANDRVKDAVRLLAGGTRNVGKVGCADLTGGVVVEHDCKPVGDTIGHPYGDTKKLFKYEYRLEVEVKVGDEPQRPEQVARMESVRRRGGCYVLANSVESAVAQILAFISAH